MNITEMQEKINYIADYYGLESQRWKAVEELIELANALTHTDLQQITEELADVIIMASQMEYLYDIHAEVERAIERKIKRQLKRIEDMQFVPVIYGRHTLEPSEEYIWRVPKGMEPPKPGTLAKVHARDHETIVLVTRVEMVTKAEAKNHKTYIGPWKLEEEHEVRTV